MIEHLDESIASQITDLIMWESPDMLEPQTIVKLAGKFLKDGTKAGVYFKENEKALGKSAAKELGVHDKGLTGIGELVVRMTRNTGQLIIPAGAMAHSTLEKDMQKIYSDGRLDNVRIHVVNGGNSAVSPEKQGEKLVTMLNKNTSGTGDIRQIITEGESKGDTHGAQESVVRLSKNTKKILS